MKVFNILFLISIFYSLQLQSHITTESTDYLNTSGLNRRTRGTEGTALTSSTAPQTNITTEGTDFLNTPERTRRDRRGSDGTALTRSTSRRSVDLR